MEVRWKLRMAAAQREVWTGAQLRRLLAERAGVQMSAASVSALMRQAPKQLKLSTLAALCVALVCQPGDLIEVDTTPVAMPARGGKPVGQQATRGQTRSRTPPPFCSGWTGSAPTAATTGSCTPAGAALLAIGAPSTTPPRRFAPAAASAGGFVRPRKGLAVIAASVAPGRARSPHPAPVVAAVSCAATRPTGCATRAISATR